MKTAAAKELASQFKEQGYVMLKGFFTKEETEALLQVIKSAGEKLEKKSGLNKDNMLFYSNLYLRNEQIREIISRKKILDVLRAIQPADYWVRWDQAVMKFPGGVAFPWHQDNSYNQLPHSHLQFWVALTQMRDENGGLWLIPGSHKKGFLPHQKIENHQVFEADESKAISVEAEQGDVVIFSSMMLHKTSPNTSNLQRWAYVVEYMNCKHFDPYINPPYFMLSKNGEPKPRLSDEFPNLKLQDRMERLKYVSAKKKNRAIDMAKRAAAKLLGRG